MSKRILKVMAVYNKIKNQPNLFIKEGCNTLHASINGEMKEVNLVNEEKVFEDVRMALHKKRVDELTSIFSYPKDLVKAIVVVLLTILFTIFAVKLSAQSSDAFLFIDNVTPDYIDVANGSDIRCGEVFLFQDSTGGKYNFNIRNIGCDEFGNTPDDLVVDLYTMVVPDGIRVYGEFGNLISGNVAVPNDGLQVIAGFTMANGPIICDGIDSYQPFQNFPPIDWALPTTNPFGTMRTLIPTGGEYNFNIEFTAYPDAFTVFWVYVHCPEQSYTHTTEVIYEEFCSNIVDVIEIDTTFIYGQCADTIIIRVPEYTESPIQDTIMDICVGDEAFLSPLFDFGLNQTQVEWVDGDIVPFKAFPVYNDTSISFIHYDDDDCVFQNTYYIEVFTDVQLNVDTVVVKRGNSITYNPDLEIYGVPVEFLIYSNMATDDGETFFLESAQQDTTFYFEYDVNGLGCFENGILHVNVIGADVYYPNVFRPSSSNPNNYTFKPVFGSTSDAVSYTLDIYTRWGEFVGNFDNSYWDGTFNGRSCDPGTFVYTSTVTLIDGSVEHYKGDVTLIQ